MQSNKSNRAIPFTLFTRIYFFIFFIMPETTEQETPVDLPTEDNQVSVTPELQEVETSEETLNIPLTNGDMGFISDMLAGAKTPGCLINIGNFINAFVGHITAYQERLQKIEQEQNAEYLNLGKEFFVLDGEGRPTMTEDQKSYVLVEGKTTDDLQDYNTRATNITAHFTEKKNDVANEINVISVSHDVLWNFKQSFLHDVSIELAQKSMNIKPEVSGNFVAILYSITQKVKLL